MEKVQNLVIGLIFTAALWTLFTAFKRDGADSTPKCAKCRCKTGAEECKNV